MSWPRTRKLRRRCGIRTKDRSPLRISACSRPCLGLCAAGCATAASYRGHPGKYAWSHEPLILFTADPARARLVEEVARATGCGLTSTNNGRLSLYAQSIEEVLAFAALTIERRADFDALPLPRALAEARGVRVADAPEQLPGQDTLF
jgi:hypothetical protein